jgi:hypothetical protein
MDLRREGLAFMFVGYILISRYDVAS